MILLILIAVIVVAALLMKLAPAIRRHRLKAQLRGDWWERFERDLRGYERTLPPHGGGIERHGQRR
jgi:hypothetical protein